MISNQDYNGMTGGQSYQAPDGTIRYSYSYNNNAVSFTQDTEKIEEDELAFKSVMNQI